MKTAEEKKTVSIQPVRLYEDWAIAAISMCYGLGYLTSTLRVRTTGIIILDRTKSENED